MQVAILVAVLCALALFNGAKASSRHFRNCSAKVNSSVQAMTNFDLKKFLGGTWIEIGRSVSPVQPDNPPGEMSYIWDSETSKVTFKHWSENQYTKTQSQYMGELMYEKDCSHFHRRPGKLEFSYFNGFTANAWVLDTDYEKYYVLYSCHQVSINVYEPQFWVYVKIGSTKIKDDATVIREINDIFGTSITVKRWHRLTVKS